MVNGQTFVTFSEKLNFKKQTEWIRAVFQIDFVMILKLEAKSYNAKVIARLQNDILG